MNARVSWSRSRDMSGTAAAERGGLLHVGEREFPWALCVKNMLGTHLESGNGLDCLMTIA
eukprot:2459255-Pyramimonas_sp.AAC.1